MIPVPNYLKQYASEKNQKSSRIFFRLKCTCGCETFFVPEKVYTKEEKELIKEYESKIPDTSWHILCGERDSDCNVRWYIRRFFIFKKYIEFPDQPSFMSVKVIKVNCSQCQKEIIVFDNRYHGYDGMISDNKEEKNYTPKFKENDSISYKIEITIENDVSLDEFNERTGEEHSYEFYSNAFSWIKICRIDANGKKKILCDEETA